MTANSHNKNKMLMVLAVAAIAVSYVFVNLTFKNPYNAIKQAVKNEIGYDGLQIWASNILSSDSRGEIDINDAPSLIRDSISFITVVESVGREEKHVLIACGGGFYHYGFRVGAPGFRPKVDSQYVYEELIDGVWGMSER